MIRRRAPRGGTPASRSRAVRVAIGIVGAVLAAFAAAPEVAAHGFHDSIDDSHNLADPYIVSSPASGDTYWPGETVTVLVPWGRASNNSSYSINAVGTVRLTITVGNTSHELTGIWENRESRYGRTTCDGRPCWDRRLWFDHVVQKGDRDTDGISLAQDALSSPGNAQSGVRGQVGGSGSQIELSKALHGFGNQSGHKVDTPAPSFSGVTGPQVTFYREASVNYRLPKIANADEAYNVTYSVTPALPAGYSLNSSTATITGTRSRSTSMVARSNYTLRATDGHSRTASLTFSLEVKTDGGIESITITSDPGTDRTYGKTTDFGNNDTIEVRVDFTHQLGTLLLNRLCLNIRIGVNTRRQCNPTHSSDKLDFTYTVQESDWDDDGISFPSNPLEAPGPNTLRFNRQVDGTTQVNRNFGAIPNDPNHKVRGRQTTPTFGTTTSPAYTWIKDNAVSQALPAATLGDGGVTYSIKESLPSGLTFTAATRTIAGTPGATQPVTTYTLVATDGDGDKAELRFSIRIDDITVSISSPGVNEGAAPATLTFAVALNKAAGRTVTVAYALDGTDAGTATAGADYTAVTPGTLTFGAADTSRTLEVAVTDDALDEPDETVRITLSNPRGAGLGTATGTGTITDDDATPTVTLTLADASIAENGGTTTVTATLSGASGHATTITVTGVAGAYDPGTDATIVIPAGATENAADTAGIVALNNTVDAPDHTVTVTASASNAHAIGAVTGASLTITDDDPTPTATLTLTPATIAENGGTTTVTAGLSHPSSEATTLTVTAAPGTGAAAGDFRLTGATLTIAAGATASTGTVTIAAEDNTVHAADKSVTVGATAAGGRGVEAPANVTLTLTENETAPRATLVLTPATIAESGTRTAATVTARLDRASDAPTTVTVTATAVSPATAADFLQSANMRLEIAPGTTASTGRVLVTAVNDTAYTGNKSVTVSATAQNRAGVTAPANVTLTITDDEMAAPGTPGNVGVTAGVGSLAVRWDAATNADGYTVQWKSGSENYADARRAVIASSTVRTYTITGLTPGTATTVSVIATRTGAADSPASTEASGTPKAAPPGKPTISSVTAGVGSLVVNWDAAANAGGYTVQWKSGSQNYNTGNRQADVPTGTTYTIAPTPPLAAGTTYTVRVIATRAHADDGMASVEATGTPKAAAPGQPTNVTVTPGVGSLGVTWIAATGSPTGYTVQWKTSAEAWAADRQTAVTGTSATIAGLTAGTDYTVRVIATRTNADDGPASATASGRPKPAPPGRVATVTVTRQVGQLGVSWPAVTNADGYKVQWKEPGEQYDAATRQHTPTGTSQTIANLTAGTSYTVRVIATRTNAADGAASYEVSGVPKAPRPAAPASIQAEPATGGVEVEWAVVADATGYTVQWKTTGQSYATTRQASVDAPTDKDATAVSYTITGLNPDADYTVRVIATREHADDGPASQEVTSKAGGGSPDPGTDTNILTVTPGTTTLVLSWPDVKDATDYRVQWKSGGESYSLSTRQTLVAQTQGNTETYTITGLRTGIAYTVRLTPRISGADLPAYERTSTTRAATPGRSTVTLTPGVGSLAVSWTAASGSPTGYRVQWKSGSESYNTGDRQASVTTGRSTTILGLPPGTPVTVRVIATHTNAAADGPASAEQTGTPKHAPPGQVETVTVTPGVGSLAVSWTEASDAGGYRVQWKSGSQNYNTGDRQAAVTTGTSTAIAPSPPLVAGTTYTVRVIATRTNADDGTASVEATGIPRAATPGQPTGVMVTPGVGSLAVRWTAATGSPTGYTVQWRIGAAAWNSGTAVTGTSHTITGLTAGTAYTVRVIATHTYGDDGPASATATGTPTATASTVPESVTVAAGVGQLTVTWSAAADASGYRVQWKAPNQNYDTVSRQADVTTGTSYTIAPTPPLVAGTRYTVRVIATRTNAADSAPSAEASGVPTAATPGQPGNVQAAAAVEGLTVTWSAATGASGYKVQWKGPGESYDAVTRQVTATGTSRELTGLQAGTAYTVRVIATRAHADDGPASAETTGTPRAAPAAQAMNVQVVAGIRSLTVSWPAAADASSYKVQWKSGEDDYNTGDRQAEVTTGTSYTIPDLTPGTAYTVRVIATRMSATDSPPSAERTGTPRAAPPGKPAGVTLTSGVRQIAVAWTAVADADRYTVQWKADGGTYTAANAETGTATSRTITGLTAGTAYTVRVTAERDHADDGPASDEAAATAWDVTLSATALALDEDPGGTNRATYTVRLSHAPTGNVTVTAASAGPAVTLAPGSLTFTTATWNTAQTVTATAADDDNTVGESVTLSHAAPGFGTVTGTVTVTVTDDDMAGLTVSAVTGDATEAQDETATVAVFDVQLDTQPTAPVTIAVASKNTSEGTAAPANLTFTATTWNTAQTVTVTGVNDDVDDDNVTYKVELDTPTGADEYTALDPVSVDVTTIDDDTAGVTFSPTTLTVTEGDRTTKPFTIVLDTEPLGMVTVYFSLYPDPEVVLRDTDNNVDVVFPAGFIGNFTTANWNMAQTVRVRGTHDNDGADDTLFIKYSLANYHTDVDVADASTKTAVTVTVEDDDVPALVVGPTALTVAEGQSATYTVKLRVAPSAAVTVDVAKADGGSTDVSFAPAADLVFTTTTWNAAQTVTVTAAADDDGRNDDTAQLTHSVTSGDTGYDGLQTSQPGRVPAVAVTVTDGDAGDIGVTVDTDLTTPGAQTTTLSVTENGMTSARYTVVLGTEPSEPVTVEVGDDPDTTVNDLDKVSATPDTLTFAVSNWDTAQTVTVAGEMDADDMHETVSLALTVTSGDTDYDGVSVDPVAVTVMDDDDPELVVSAATAGLAVTEGQSATYTLALNSQPEGPVTVTVTSDDAAAEVDTDTTKQTRTLTFAAAAWNTAQTVTVTAPADDNGIGETPTLSHAAASSDGDYTFAARAAENVAVTVTDTNPPGLVVDTDPNTGGAQTTLTLNEDPNHADQEKTYSVRLNAQPAGSVTVAASVTGDTDAVGVAPETLLFTGTTWNTAQTVTATAKDDTDTVSETVTVSHTVQGTEDTNSYPTTLAAVDVTVTVMDDDGGLDVGTVSGNTTEAGGTATFTVELQSAPNVAVTVGVASQDTSEGIAAPESLTFTATDWNMAQTVTVTGQNDDIDDGNKTYQVKLTPTSTDAVYGSLDAVDVELTNEDDTDTAALAVSGVTGQATEAGGTATFTVNLETEPEADVAVTVASQDPGEGTAAPGSLTFTATSWETAQTVTVTGVNDDVDDGNETYAIHLDPAGAPDDAYTALATHMDTMVTTVDDDTAGLGVDTDPNTDGTQRTLTVYEDANHAEHEKAYPVQLTAEPGGPVTVRVVSDDAAVEVDTDTTKQERLLTFTAMTWDTAQTVTVTAADDADTVSETVTVSHTVQGTGDTNSYPTSLAAVDVMVTVMDDDGGLDLGTVSGNTTEAGGTATFTVALLSAPNVAVAVAVASQDRSEGIAAPRNLTFNATTWNTAQTVTVTGQDDDIDDGNETYQVKLTPTSTDMVYGNLDPVNVTLTNEDDTAGNTDTAALAVGTVTGQATEAGGTATFTVNLATEPEADVTMTVASQDPGEGTAAPESLTFTATDWDTAQTVTVTGVNDDVDDGNQSYAIHLDPAGAPDDAYTALATHTSTQVTTVDDDTAGLWVDTDPNTDGTQRTLTLNEDANHADHTKTYPVRLTAEPGGPVTVRVSSDDAAVDVDTDTTKQVRLLTFTAMTWDAAQTVTATAADDDDATSETVTLSHTVHGTGDVNTYPTTLAAVTVSVSVTDDDTVGVTVDTDPSTPATVDTTGLTVSDDGSTTTDTYTVVLNTQPNGAVTIAPDVPATPDVVGVEPGGLTFTATTWNTAQTVTVSGKTDADAADTGVSLTHTLTTTTNPNGDYTGVSVAAVSVTVTDTDTAGVTVDTDLTTAGAQATTLAVTEGAAGAYTLALATQPSAPVTLALAATPAEVSLTPDRLTFTRTAYAAAQTVTVSGTQDADTADETVTLAHTLTTVGGGDYAAVSVADVTVNVTDDEVVVGFESTTQSAAEAAGTASVCVAVTNPQDSEALPQSFSLRLRTADGTATDGSAAVAGTDYTALDTDVGPFDATTRRSCTSLALLDNAVDAADKTLTLGLDYRLNTATPDPNDKEGTEDYVILNPGTLTFTITNDDARGVTVDTDLTTPGAQATTLSVSEDGTTTAAYAVVLATQPTAPVTIAAADAPDRVNLTPAGPLVFTATTWAMAQTVTVTGTADDLDATTETVTLTHTLTTRTTPPGDYAGETVAAVTVTVTDDDTPGLLVTPTALALQEAALHADHTGTYTLRLNTQPSGPVTVRVDNADDASAVTANGVAANATLALTFAANAWNTAQTVTVAAGQDDDGDGETVTLTHTTASGDGNFQYTTPRTAENVTVTVTDDDPKGVTVAPTSLAVTEETATGATFTVVLDTQPAAAVTVSVDNANDASAVTANGVAGNATLSLVFAATAWDTAQTVTVVAGDDANSAPETETLALSVANYAGVTTVADVEVQVTDNDVPNLSLSAAGLTGDGVEEDTAESYTVALTTQPSGLVTVAVSSSDANRATLAAGTQAAAANVTLTFAATTWDTAQTVTVAARRDADAVDAPVTLTHDPSGAEYATLAAVSLTFTVTDADTRGIALDADPATPATDEAGPLTVYEAATHAEHTAPYTVRLATQPVGGNVTVTLTNSDNDALSVSPLHLVFTPGNWATARTVRATAREDLDGTSESVTLTHTAVGGDYPAAMPVSAALSVSVMDDDAPGLRVSVTALRIDEPADGRTPVGRYTVRLNTEPGGPVTVGITEPTPNPDIGASPTDLTFDATTWAMAQTVTVTPQADADAADDATTLRHTVTGSGDADYPTSLTADVAVTVEDAQTAGVTLGATALGPLREDDAPNDSDTYTVVLDTLPTAPVTIAIATSDENAVRRTPVDLTFTAGTWNTAQTVTATAAADDDAADERVTLTHTVTGAAEYAAVRVPAVTVRVTDDEEPGLALSMAPVTVNEDATAAYTVALATQPTGDVAVRIRAAHDDVALQTAGEATPGAAVWLSFTPAGWDTAQTVTVHALADADTDDEAATLTHTATGGDYAGLAAVSLTFTVTDTTSAANPAPGTNVPAAFAASALPDQTYKERQQVRVQLPAATTGNPPLTYTLTPALPPGLRYDATTRRIGGAATAVPTPAIGTYTHTVTDADGDDATQTVRIEIVANPQPTFAAPAPRYTRGETYTLPAPSVADGGRLVFALTPALPAGLRYTPPVPSGGPGTYTYADGGTITGVPDGGLPTNQYTLTVTDPDGDMATVAFRLAQPAAVPPPPPVDGQPTFGNAAVEPQQYRQGETITPVILPAATGGDAPLSYALTPALPAGLTYTAPADAATGGTLAGTPTALQDETTYTLTATDADGDTATLPFPLTVEADLTPSFGDATVAAHGYPVGTAIAPLVLPAATGGNAPLSYALTPTLPPGLTYTAPADPTVSGGTLAGTPTEVRAAATYTLTATDTDGDTATLTFPLTITATGRLVPGEGTTAYPIGGQQLTITRHSDTPAVEIDLPTTLARDVTVTLSPPAADVPLARGQFGFGTGAAARAVVDISVVPVPAGGVSFCLPVPAALRTEAAGRAVMLLHYDGRQWAPVAGSEEDAAEGQVCATGVTTFSPFAVGYANAVPTFADAPPEPQRYEYDLAMAIAPVVLPAATGGDAPLSYALTPPDALPAGLTYTAPVGTTTAGRIAGTPTAPHPATTYTLTATDRDGDRATLTFIIAVERAQVTVADARGQEGGTVVFPVTLSRPLTRPLTLTWTANTPGSATPGEDYHAETAGRLTLAAGASAGTLTVRMLDDRRVEPPETFTVTVTLPAGVFAEMAAATAVGTIEDDDTEQARRRSLGMVLAGVGRTLATDAVDVIGDRFVQQPTTMQATVGGQEVSLRREGDTARWRHAAGVAYGVARALGVEVGSPVEGGDGQLGQVRGAAWSALTRHLRDPHAPAAPLSAWDSPGTFAAPSGTGLGGPSPAHWGTPSHAGGTNSIPPPSGRGLEPAPDLIRGGGRAPAWERPADDTSFGSVHLPGLAGYGEGLGQRGFDRAHAATPEAAAWTLRAPVGFRRVSGAEVMSGSTFEIPLRSPTPAADPPTPDAPREPEGMAEEASAPVDTAAQAEAAAWTLWGRGTASGFDGKPKDDFSMDGTVFTGYLGLDYRLQPNVLLGLAVAHSQGDVDYETPDVTKGDVDITLTSVLPYAHWSPRPGLGVWGLFGAGWGNLALRDEAGKVKTDLEMLMAAVGARQELLTWRQIDVALKADAFLTELEAGADDRLPKTAGDAQRLRLMLEGRTAWALSEASHLTPIFEIGGRWDGGKAETGVGAELGGGFEYAHTKLGLGIEARGRYLLAHQKSAFDEWGASLTLKLDPGADKRGLWLALAPVWGAEASQVEQMWGSAEAMQAGAETDTTPGLSPAQVEFDVGYGMVTHEGTGLLTTYGGLSMSGPATCGVRLGGRIELGEWIDLSVEGERTTQAGGAEHQVALYGHLGW